MVEYKITPADHKIIEGISPTDNWRDLTVSFRNKVLPAGNLDKPIGNKCYKLLKSLIKKDKVSSSTLSKGCPSLNKKNMKDQTKSITKMEMKKDRDMKKKADRDNDAQDKDDLKRLKRKEEFGAKLKENEGKNPSASKQLLDTIVKQQNQAKVQLIAGQVDSVRNILQDTTQPNDRKEHYNYLKQEFEEYKKTGGKKEGLDFEKEIMERDMEEFREQMSAENKAEQVSAEQAYADAMGQANDEYSDFVIPQQPVVIPPYSVENDPMFQDPRNN